MCKHKNETKTASAHRLTANALLARLEELVELRDTFEVVRERHEQNREGLDEIEEAIEQEETRIRDDARALGIFADEYECDCGCGCAGDTKTDPGFTDEEVVPAPSRPRAPSRMPAPMYFGALGVAVGSIIADWLDRRPGDHDE